MCIEHKKTEEQLKKWLKNKPETMILYKSVVKMAGKYYPTYKYTDCKFTTTNRIRRNGREFVYVFQGCSTYRPYYHLFRYKKYAKKWEADYGYPTTVLKCEVKKEDITAVGDQTFGPTAEVIVTKAFKIVGEVE